MKQFFFIFLSIISLTATAQTRGKGKLYGYKQGVVSGIVQKDLNEDGTETTRAPKASANYFIYLVTSSRAYPSELWVNGEIYGVSVRSITKTPVEGTDQGTKSKVLVPETTQRVIQLTPTPAVSGKKSKKGRSLSSSHELVVVYKQNGQFYYQTLSRIESLATAALQ